MDLSFLNNINLGEAEVSQPREGNRVSLQPEKGDIKVFRNGRIYFSDEFRAKVSGGGIDFVDSRKWGMYPEGAPDLVFICIVPKEKIEDKAISQKVAAKIDVRQESTKSPIASVRDRLIPMLKEIYGANTEASSMELKVVENAPLTKTSGIYSIPKVVSSGEHKGEDDSVRRENVTFYPLVLVETNPVIEDDGEARDAAQEENFAKSPADFTQGELFPERPVDE
jgi:hypothetical protein